MKEKLKNTTSPEEEKKAGRHVHIWAAIWTQNKTSKEENPWPFQHITA